MFAYREAPQEATRFFPFELLYGRKVRGPVQILKELWTKKTDVPEVKTSYQYVLELRERLDDTMTIALELKRSQSKNKRLYDRGAKRRVFQVGDKVLILQPTDNIKLLLQWHGPFVVERCGNGNNYVVEVNKRTKTYHVNILKTYFERKSDVESFGDTITEPEETKTIQASVGIARNNAGSNSEVHESDSHDDKLSVDEEEMLELGGHGQKETLRDVKLGLWLTKSQEENLWQVLGAYDSVFTDVPGKSNVIQHQITLTDSTPIRSKPYPLPYVIRENLKTEIQEMLDLGIFQTSASPYPSPIVIVTKKDGSNRICVDYRKLNKVTVADPEQMKTPEDLFQRLGKSNYFSKIDLSKGYWQIPEAKEDVKKTAFVTPDGNYEFIQMPFVMKNSGATLVQELRMLISNIENVDSYIDDLIVYTEDWDTHIRVLDELINRLQQANLTARPTKCVFGAKSVEFLGHQVGFDWITVNDNNLEKIRMAQRPTTKKEVRSFLGLVNYYHAHIPLFAAISAPLSDLTRKGQPNKVQWGKAQERAFLTLQESLPKKPILKLPDHQKPFILQTDASNCGLGASLMQEHDDKLYPVAYASKKLSSAECKYSTLETGMPGDCVGND